MLSTQIKNWEYTKLKIGLVETLRHDCNDIHTASCANEVISPVIQYTEIGIKILRK